MSPPEFVPLRLPTHPHRGGIQPSHVAAAALVKSPTAKRLASSPRLGVASSAGTSSRGRGAAKREASHHIRRVVGLEVLPFLNVSNQISQQQTSFGSALRSDRSSPGGRLPLRAVRFAAPSGPSASRLSQQKQGQASRGGTRAVTVDNVRVGMAVTRGMAWRWGDQDGGHGSQGTLLGPSNASGYWMVRWANGNVNVYRLGGDLALPI